MHGGDTTSPIDPSPNSTRLRKSWKFSSFMGAFIQRVDDDEDDNGNRQDHQTDPTVLVDIEEVDALALASRQGERHDRYLCGIGGCCWKCQYQSGCTPMVPVVQHCGVLVVSIFVAILSAALVAMSIVAFIYYWKTEAVVCDTCDTQLMPRLLWIVFFGATASILACITGWLCTHATSCVDYTGTRLDHNEEDEEHPITSVFDDE